MRLPPCAQAAGVMFGIWLLSCTSLAFHSLLWRWGWSSMEEGTPLRQLAEQLRWVHARHSTGAAVPCSECCTARRSGTLATLVQSSGVL